MNIHPPRLGALARSRRTSLIAVLGLSTSLLAALPAAAEPAPTPSASTAPAPAADPLASLKAEAKKQNKPVEIESYRTETSTTYANPDGKTLNAEVHSTPIRVQKDGAWQPIDMTLVEEGGVIRPKAIKGDLTLSAGGDKALVKLKNEKGAVALAAPSKLPKPRLSGNTATYPSAYGKGVDLVVTANPTGFHQEIVIRERPTGKLKVRVPVDLPKGMRYGKDDSGQLALLADKTGKEIADITAAPMTDAAAAKDLEAGRTGTAAMTVQDGALDQELVITPDAKFLADPAVTYPVTVAAASENWTGTGIDGDTYINSEGQTSGWSNSGKPDLIAGKSNSGTKTWRTYIRFNIKGTPLEGGTVENADLRLWNHQSNTCDSEINSGIVALPITTPWDISTLSWSNQPSTTWTAREANKGAYDIDCSRGEGELWYSIEQMTQMWMDGYPDHGVQLTPVNESDLTNWRWYRSYEYGGYDTYPFTARGPVLIIKYIPGAVPSPEMIITESDGQPSDEPLSYEEAVANRLTVESTTPTAPSVTLDDVQRIAEGTENAFEVDPDNLASSPEEEPGVPDLTPPAVVGTLPQTGAENATTTDPIQAVFDEPVSGVVFTVKNPDGTAVAGTLTMLGGDLAASFKPSENLQPGTAYTAEVASAQDAAGNAMTAPHTWSFTTGQEAPSPTPTVTPTNTPTPKTISLPVQTDTWIDDQGSSSPDGIYLWTGAYGSSNPRTIERAYLAFDTSALADKKVVDAKLELWNATSFGCGDSASGIKAQQVTTAWSIETLRWDNQPSVTATGEAVAKDPGGCTDDSSPPSDVAWSWPVTGIVQSWAAGQANHGLLLRGVDESDSAPLYDRGFDSTESQQDNPDAHPPVLKVTYTDTPNPTPTATPTAAPDTAPPTILKVEPADGSEDAPANAQVKVTFSEPVTDAHLSLTDLFEEEEVPGSTTMDASNTVLTFTPDHLLDFYYWAEISGAKDAAGNVMDDSYGWSFSIEQQIPTPTEPSACRTAPAWTSGGSYPVGTQVKHRGHAWESIALGPWQFRVEPGTDENWGWRDLGACTSAFSSSTAEKQAGPESPVETLRDAKPSVDKAWTRSLETRDGTDLVPTTTPELLVKVSDPLKRRSTVEVEVAHDPKSLAQGKGLIWSGSVRNTTPGASVIIQVPQGKLVSGWKTRWRVRVTSEDGSIGSWSAWQMMIVQKTDPVQGTERTEQSKRTAAEALVPKSFPYNRLTWEGCWSKPETGSWTRRFDGSKSIGHASNSFNWCARREARGEAFENMRNPETGKIITRRYVGHATYRITVRAYTHAGGSPKSRNPEIDTASGLHGRDIRYTVRIDNVKWHDAGGKRYFDAMKLRLGVAVSHDKCEVTSGPRDDSFSKEDLLTNWENKEAEWIIHSAKDKGERFSRTSACMILPTIVWTSPLSYSDPGGDITNRIGFQRPLVRCDTAPAIYNYTGGCIFPDATPTLVYDATKKAKIASVAKHVWDSYYNTKWTVPTDDRKQIPGRHPHGKLHRLLERPDIPWLGDPDDAPWGQVQRNRTHSTAECRRKWPNISPDAQGLDCDEFPFASTHESPLIAGGTNYSARYIDDKENSSAGSDLKNFYMIYRRLSMDPFWVYAKTLPGEENQPPAIWN
ncbi:hypothetical protein Ppa06_57220 [Planomonospora parontospora subsp. parontospora]|uniref:DNRLRE domain-containing protein n=2 Tax=Planomonospora parontospora TaxID=58119 RepID=A0AA37BLW0_9ACTN|nr:DNRLRE domain-containing protein [Planomonospora parontospora]GGK91011.1 hypothetical protein GCM10010126_58080 [Planomonospora parontospora]GII11924.1 hypothetical protein Ppa06_57220 [Planomonospora parontospora subsp. parontospora]